MLPTSSAAAAPRTSSPSEFFYRLAHWKQMDFEYAAWQMINLPVDPARVYRTTGYHHATKVRASRARACVCASATSFCLSTG